MSDYSWRKVCEEIAEDLLESEGKDVEFLSIAEAVGDRIGNPNDLTFNPVDYISYLVKNAEVKITLPKERL